jgi:putative acetyltransferase
VIIEPGDPDRPDARAILAAHLAFAHDNSPPQSVHALDVSGLLTPDVSCYWVREEASVVSVGALRRLTCDHAEIKSMHTAAVHRGRGYARAMLDYLLGVARERSYRRVSLETGALMPSHQHARSMRQSDSSFANDSVTTPRATSAHS